MNKLRRAGFGNSETTRRLVPYRFVFGNHLFAERFTPGNLDSTDQQLAECVRRGFSEQQHTNRSDIPLAGKRSVTLGGRG